MKLIYKNLFLTASLVLAAASSSCTSEEKKSAKEEGIIEFNTRAIDPKDPLFKVAPSEAILKFKKEKFIIEMTVMGIFNTSIIGNTKTKTLAQTVKFMNINQFCIEHEKGIREDNLDYALSIVETKETKEIIGLECYKAKVTKIKDPAQTFDVWYTKELGLEDCNALTPYAQLKGILLDYRIKKMGLELHFTARSYKKVEVTDQTFQIPGTMKMVSKEEMAGLFTDLE